MSVKRILFVCVENANRSQMAEAFARRHGGSAVEAYSCGSRPSGRINPKAVEAMRAIDCELSGHWSKSPQDLPPVEFDVAVTMGCGDECPNLRARRLEDWDIPDPKTLPEDQFHSVRNLIEDRVRQLLAVL